MVVHCTARAKRRRSLPIIVSTLAHLCQLENLGVQHVMWWSIRCRRWKPMICKRILRCAVRRSAECSRPRVHGPHPYSRVSVTSACTRTLRVNGACMPLRVKVRRLISAYCQRWRRQDHPRIQKMHRVSVSVFPRCLGKAYEACPIRLIASGADLCGGCKV